MKVSLTCGPPDSTLVLVATEISGLSVLLGSFRRFMEVLQVFDNLVLLMFSTETSSHLVLLPVLVPLRDYRITVFATCHAIRRSYGGPSSSSSSSSSEFDRPYLCRSWQRLVSHRLLCSREEGPSNMAAAAAEGSEEQRRRQVFTVHCTSSKTKSHRRSCFYVTDAGVELI